VTEPDTHKRLFCGACAAGLGNRRGIAAAGPPERVARQAGRPAARAIRHPEGDRLREFCGLFGLWGDADAARHAYFGLYALQHRGQEAAGIAASDGQRIRLHKGPGLVSQVFADRTALDALPGAAAIAHNRYSTTGASNVRNAQPILIEYKRGQLAAAHNGNLVNSAVLRRAMEEDGSIFQTTSDSEIVLHLVARSREPDLPEAIAESLGRVVGAYCFLFLSPEALVAVRDPFGWRPLCFGRLGEAPVVASESCAMDILGAEYVRSVEPGEMLVFDARGVHSRRLPAAPRQAACVFEFIYFARPDSRIFGEKADKIRRAFGRRLAQEQPADADIVIAVPDSANTAALGYAEAAGLRFEIGLIRNHYVGRTFISPYQHERDIDVRVKFNPVAGVLRGKRVVVVEDSIVRGTTLRKLIRLVRGAGAAEVHVRVSSPPIRCPCFYGIDMSTRRELIAASHAVEEIRDHIGADSLRYLSVEGMLSVVPDPGGTCTACFTGDYPTEVPGDFHKEQFERSDKAAAES
jgi:amidophosphoribosyltransferase